MSVSPNLAKILRLEVWGWGPEDGGLMREAWCRRKDLRGLWVGLRGSEGSDRRLKVWSWRSEKVWEGLRGLGSQRGSQGFSENQGNQFPPKQEKKGNALPCSLFYPPQGGSIRGLIFVCCFIKYSQYRLITVNWGQFRSIKISPIVRLLVSLSVDILVSWSVG